MEATAIERNRRAYIGAEAIVRRLSPPASPNLLAESDWEHLHRELDEAVAAAYGWPADLSDDEILERLFELNQERAGVAMSAGAAESVAAD